MYSIETGTVEATNGTPVTITIQHVDISPEVASVVFDRGEEVGDWGAKHKVWFCQTIAEVRQVRAASRFYYGWHENSESVTRFMDGYIFESRYAC